jgi:ribonuclease HIII
MPTSIAISLKELQNLKNYILKTGLKRAPTTTEYELLRIEDGEVKIVVYKSGKLVFNDNPKSKLIIEAILEKEKVYDYVLGTDEVGKGEWYGPLVVACVALTPSELARFREMGVRDSKSIRTPILMQLAQQILKTKLKWKPLIIPPYTFNQKFAEFKRENKTLNELLAWAHSAAIKDMLDLVTYTKAKIVIDKFDVEKTYRRLYGIDESRLTILQTSKETEVAVNVASILAKYTFEREVDKLNRFYNIDLRKASPSDIDPQILPQVAKIHFKNVKAYAQLD